MDLLSPVQLYLLSVSDLKFIFFLTGNLFY